MNGEQDKDSEMPLGCYQICGYYIIKLNENNHKYAVCRKL